jgi:hypothetical protein
MNLSIPAVPPTLDEWVQTVVGDEPPFSYKRHPYLHHKEHVLELHRVFTALQAPIPRGGLTFLSEMSKVPIPVSTLQSWKTAVRKDPTWRPSCEAYKGSKRAFTDLEEERLVASIRANYLDKGLYYSDQDFKEDALQFVRILKSEAEERRDETRFNKLGKFECSRSFMRAFRERHRYSLRRPNLKRRPTVNEEQAQEFIRKVQGLLKKYPADRIINVDETNWRTVASGFLTWGLKGADSVQCNIDNDDKEGVTVIGAINAAGEKLPLTVIGKGKTLRCLAAYDLKDDVWKSHSESGWTTSNVMCGYFAQLRQKLFPDADPVLVILDTYAAHRSAEVREVAALWGIDLVFIPPGCTDRLQPLDRKVFGVLKSYARQQWPRHYHATFGQKIKRSEIAQNLVHAWSRISDQTIENAWDIYAAGWNIEEEEVEEVGLEDGEYQQLFSIHDLLDM